LETRRPIELLPDRSTETLAAWLRTHPEVEMVSRDRGGEYAAAAKQGARPRPSLLPTAFTE
jgi:transposase